MKTVIIGGGGTVGSAAAFCLGRRSIVDEIVFVDAKENMAHSHAMDMEQALANVSSTMIRAGRWEDLAGASLVIVAAGLPEKQVGSRNEFLAGNRVIIREIATHVKAQASSAIILTASNPVDVLNYDMYLALQGSRSKIIGFCQNDSTRFCWAVARVLGADARAVGGLAIGEHGASIYLFETVCVHGDPVILTQKEQREVVSLVENWFGRYQKLDSRRSSGWTSGENIANLVDAMVNNSNQTFVCSVILDGEYSANNVSIGVPVMLGREGIRQIIELPLLDQNRHNFNEAVRRLHAFQ